jgi:hypothetical protein
VRVAPIHLTMQRLSTMALAPCWLCLLASLTGAVILDDKDSSESGPDGPDHLKSSP